VRAEGPLLASADSRFRTRYGRWALVAGGSEGLGAEFGRQLAARGLDVVLVAEAAEPLETHARALAAEYGVEARPVVVDLSQPDAADRLRDATRGLEVGLLVCNAASALLGPFLDQDVGAQLAMIDLNCRAPLLLVQAFVRPMVERGRGGIVLLSSMSAFQGAPLIAVYAATKAFDLVLGEALWDELRDHGVDVLALCPGATRTPGWRRSRPRDTGGLVRPMEVEPVVADALAALGRRPSAVAGRGNRIAAGILGRLLPRSAAVRTVGRAMRRTYPRG
jgi:hypothetical protein